MPSGTQSARTTASVLQCEAQQRYMRTLIVSVCCFRVCCVLCFVSCVVEKKKTQPPQQGSLLAVHYCLLAALVPLPVAIAHIFLGGWLTATIVTVTHTAEEYAVEDDTSYVETQFKTTRDAITKDPLSE